MRRLHTYLFLIPRSHFVIAVSPFPSLHQSANCDKTKFPPSLPASAEVAPSSLPSSLLPSPFDISQQAKEEEEEEELRRGRHCGPVCEEILFRKRGKMEAAAAEEKPGEGDLPREDLPQKEVKKEEGEAVEEKEEEEEEEGKEEEESTKGKEEKATTEAKEEDHGEDKEEDGEDKKEEAIAEEEDEEHGAKDGEKSKEAEGGEEAEEATAEVKERKASGITAK